ncbi:MAG: DUF3786 domain-containing protein [Candidatus Omnitrophica bacterium]|nr:DUF3786 domain-containing protein [Candidatus Omnitrophota bacterium]
MSYDLALAKSWLDLEGWTKEKKFSVSLLADEYEIDAQEKRILSLSCNAPSKDYLSVLILHYLIKELKGLPALSGEWISFKELAGGEGYFTAFKKRVIDPIARKYGSNPRALFDLSKRFKVKKSELAPAGVELEVLKNVSFLITVEAADDEFGASANLLFDKNIKDVFCTEDVTVLAEFVAHNI